MRAGTLILFLFSLTATAEVVQQVGADKVSVVVSHGAKWKWQVGDTACVVRGRDVITCGPVQKVGSQAALVKLKPTLIAIQKGDVAKISARSRATASNNMSATLPTGASSPINVAAGANFGTNYLFTLLRLEYGISPKFTIGVSPVYSVSAFELLTASAFGGIAFAAYYFNGYFQGPWVQVSAGMLSIRASNGITTESASSIIAQGIVGYRLGLLPHLSAGVGVGGQYVTDPSLSLVTVNFASVQPLFFVDIGYNF